LKSELRFSSVGICSGDIFKLSAGYLHWVSTFWARAQKHSGVVAAVGVRFLCLIVWIFPFHATAADSATDDVARKLLYAFALGFISFQVFAGLVPVVFKVIRFFRETVIFVLKAFFISKVLDKESNPNAQYQCKECIRINNQIDKRLGKFRHAGNLREVKSLDKLNYEN
jgi:hypothetical protein